MRNGKTRATCVFCEARIELVTANGFTNWRHDSDIACKRPQALSTRVFNFLRGENLYCRSELIEMINSGELISRRINFSTKSAVEVATWLRGGPPSDALENKIELLRAKIARLHGELGASQKELRRLRMQVIGTVAK